MKILHVSSSDGGGGAAIAALRIHQSLARSNIDSSMFVAKKISDQPKVFSYKNNITKLYALIKTGIGAKVTKLQLTENNVIHSISFIPSRLEKFINKSSFDLVHLHWVQGEMISIESIGRINKPLVWTLHDNWAFLGSEHLPLNESDIRYKEGYLKSNKPKGHKLFDFDRWCWERKKKNWVKQIPIVCPSEWLANCVKQSALMKSWPVKVIPNPLDVEIFKPFDLKIARELFNLPQDKKIILFGSMDGTNNKNKGWDLLSNALKIVSTDIPDAISVIFGQSDGDHSSEINMPIIYVGKLNDSQSLAMLYSAADITIVPSRIESFGQIASESISCGTPAIAFDCTGLKDVIKNDETGFLVDPYDYFNLGKSIIKLLKNKSKINQFKIACRERALKLWSYEAISKKYIDLYLKILNK